MKKLFAASCILLCTLMFASRLLAQNPIPSFGVPVIADPTIFEEMDDAKTLNGNLSSFLTPTLHERSAMGKRKMLVKVERSDSRELEWATITIYSLDGLTTHDPYTVMEGVIYEASIDERLWGVRVINASSNAKLSVWIE